MTLSEFIKKRLEELGHNRSWLVNHGDLDWSTLSNIDRGLSIRKVTQEKLAKALHCSQGDIQKCMAEVPNPLREEAERPEGNAGISITAKAKKTVIKKVVPAPDPEDEEPAEVFQPEAESTDELFPVYHSVYDEDKEEGAREYRKKLKKMVLSIMANGRPGEYTLADMYTDIGMALVKELVSCDEAE